RGSLLPRRVRRRSAVFPPTSCAHLRCSIICSEGEVTGIDEQGANGIELEGREPGYVWARGVRADEQREPARVFGYPGSAATTVALCSAVVGKKQVER